MVLAFFRAVSERTKVRWGSFCSPGHVSGDSPCKPLVSYLLRQACARFSHFSAFVACSTEAVIHPDEGTIFHHFAPRVVSPDWKDVSCTSVPLIGQQQLQMNLLVYLSLPLLQRNAVITTCSPPTANRCPVRAPQRSALGPFVPRQPCSQDHPIRNSVLLSTPPSMQA